MHNIFGDIMQENDELVEEKQVNSRRFFFEKVVLVQDLSLYEFGLEFFLVSPDEINDLYNQN